MLWSPTLWLKASANAAFFALRQGLRWSRGQPQVKGESWDHAFSTWPEENRSQAEALATSLKETFGLNAFTGRISRRFYRKNVYLLHLLDQVLRPDLFNAEKRSRVFAALDVGTADWDYVFALHGFLQQRAHSSSASLALTGLEIDGYGIYPDGYSRADYAQAYVALLQDSHVQMHFEDALKASPPPQDLVTCFFPFILPYQILAWGMPLSHLKPQALLSRQAGWVKPGGHWLIFTHAEEERAPLLAHLKTLPHMTLLRQGPARSLLEGDAESYAERWYWLLRRIE